MNAHTSAPVVATTDDLTKVYGDRIAVDKVNITVNRGEVYGFLGPNGAGKTTTLETCEGYRRPQQGSVRVLGLDPHTDRRALLPRIGVMLQNGGAWSGVRAVEMLRHIASLHAHPLDIDMLVERLGLGSCGRTPYRRLSGGQQQRLALAQAAGFASPAEARQDACRRVDESAGSSKPMRIAITPITTRISRSVKPRRRDAAEPRTASCRTGL